MLIGQNSENIFKSKLSVDKWNISHDKEQFSENYEGQVLIEQTDEHKYLGFMLSSKGDNMANINYMKRKSHGITRSIFAKLNSLNLKQYYFESAIIMMNAILRSSIYYACETYYDLKEREIRSLERIEENFLRKLLKTGAGCPITQLYLEVGQIPGRFQIIKTRLLFLKNILNEDQTSRVYKFFDAQEKNPKKGDWVSICKLNMKEINLGLTVQEIKEIKKTKFKIILKKKITEAAFEYLKRKQGKKGGEIEYKSLQIANYLRPYNSNLSIEEKQEIFAIRNGMVNIPANYGSEKECKCGMKENTAHIYECKILNNERPKLEFRDIYSEQIGKIRIIFERFKENMIKRENYLMNETRNYHVTNGPLFSEHDVKKIVMDNK